MSCFAVPPVSGAGRFPEGKRQNTVQKNLIFDEKAMEIYCETEYNPMWNIAFALYAPPTVRKLLCERMELAGVMMPAT